MLAKALRQIPVIHILKLLRWLIIVLQLHHGVSILRQDRLRWRKSTLIILEALYALKVVELWLLMLWTGGLLDLVHQFLILLIALLKTTLVQLTLNMNLIVGKLKSILFIHRGLNFDVLIL